MDPMLMQAFEAYQRGDAARAGAICEEVLRRQPAHAGAALLLGAVAMQAGRLPDAVRLLGEAVRLAPADPAAQHAYGEALRASGRHEEAAGAYRAALALNAGMHQSHNGLCICLLALGRHAEAAEAAREAVRLAPDVERYHVNLGQALASQGKDQEAEPHFRAALRLRPNYPTAQNNLGLLLYKARRHADALPLLQAAVRLQPNYAEAHLNLGNVLLALGDPLAAVGHLREAARLRPGYAKAINNLGLALAAIGHYADALRCCEQARTAAPGLAEAHMNVGNLRIATGMPHLALPAYAEAQRLAPRPATEAMLIRCRESLCDWSTKEQDEARLRELAALPGDDDVVGPFHALNHDWPPELTASLARHRTRVLLEAAADARRGLAFQHPRRKEGRLRIGYLSADFHDHATMHLMGGVFGLHDRTRFEVYGYSCGAPDDGPYRRRAREGCDVFRDLRDLSLVDAARTIHADGVHVLIDLKGYTHQARPEIVAARPAPLVAHAIGYAGTLGGLVDYLVADPVVAPRESWGAFTEPLAVLPGCYLVADDTQAVAPGPQTRGQHGLPQEGFVFACFNQSYKIHPRVFDIWARLLRGAPGSVLWLFAPDEPTSQNLVREAEKRGVEGSRVVFARHLPKPEHLARLALAGLFLDTLPYNAHTTSADSLWAGVPVVTMAGRSMAGRVAASMLTAAGLPELITRSAGEYEALALRLATRPAELSALRARLTANRTSCPLFQTARWVRNLERALETMWRRYEQGLPAESFEVPDVGG